MGAEFWSSSARDAMRDSLAVMGGDSPVDFDVTFIALIILFLVLLVIINKYLVKPYLATVDLRFERIDGAKAEAIEAQRGAGEIFVEYEAKLAAALKDGETERARIRADGKGVERQILTDARAEVDAIVEQTQAALQAEVKKAEVDLNAAAKALSEVIIDKVLAA